MERNRDEWMLRMRRMGLCPCKQPRRPIARFRPNPSGKCFAGRSAALRRLRIAELSTAHRALHSIPAKYLCDPEKILNRFLHVATANQRARKFYAACGLVEQTVDRHPQTGRERVLCRWSPPAGPAAG